MFVNKWNHAILIYKLNFINNNNYLLITNITTIIMNMYIESIFLINYFINIIIKHIT